MSAVVLVLAKAPVPGRVKTRLARTEGGERAARLASAALLDTLEAAAAALTPARCFLALEGDLTDATGGAALAAACHGWAVLPQRGATFAERIVDAHTEVHARTGCPVVQIGMDTPHVGAAALGEVADRLAGGTRLPVLGAARDGGWWVLGSTGPGDLTGLEDVPMSTARTGADTRALLRRNAGGVQGARVLVDVDTAADAEHVARRAPDSRFAAVWRERPAAGPTGRRSVPTRLGPARSPR